MSLGRELSLDAGAAFAPDEGGVTSSRRQNKTIAGRHRDATPIGEDKVDRAERAVEKLGVAVLVLGVTVAGMV